MNGKIFIIILCLCGLLCSCGEQKGISLELRRAAYLVDNRPDSAVVLLERMPHPERLAPLNYAAWCLLHTQAKDKAEMKHTTDSFINQAIRYYQQANEPTPYVRSLYFRGRVLQDMGKLEEAAASYIQAMDVGGLSLDYEFLFLIASRLGMLYGRQGLAEHALQTYQRAFSYAMQSNDKLCISYAYSFLGRGYGLMQQWEMAIGSYRKGLALAEKEHLHKARILALQECGDVYVQIQNFEKAKEFYNRMLYYPPYDHIKKNSSAYYLSMGNLYRMTHQTDSAVYCLNKALTLNGNDATRREVYRCFSLLYEEQGEFEKALTYNRKYKGVVDSIHRSNNPAALAEISTLYEKEKIQLENTRLASRNLYLILSGIIGLLFLLGLIFFLVRFFRRRIQTSEERIGVLEDQSASVDSLKQSRLQLLEQNSQLSEQNLDLTDTIQTLQQTIQKMEVEKPVPTSSPTSYALLIKLKEEADAVLTDEEWKELFFITDQLHQHFVERLSACYPKLTVEDLKLCSLTKLGFSHVGIADLLHINEDSLTKRKQRFKEKLGMKQWENKGGFVSFIKDF